MGSTDGGGAICGTRSCSAEQIPESVFGLLVFMMFWLIYLAR